MKEWKFIAQKIVKIFFEMPANPVFTGIVETAKANNLKTYNYVEYLLEEIPKHMNDTNCSFIENFLPWSENLPAEIHKL